AGAVQAEGAEARAIGVDRRGGAEALGESAKLTARGRAFREIHEVHRDPPLREEAERLASVLAVVEAEDLDVRRHEPRRPSAGTATPGLSGAGIQRLPDGERDRGGARVSRLPQVRPVIVGAAGREEVVPPA